MQLGALFLLLFLFQLFNSFSSSTGNHCHQRSSSLSYQCLNRFPSDRTNIEQLEIICDASTNATDLLEKHERFYSIIQSFQISHCPMKILYLDRYTLWNYLQSMSITYARLTRISVIALNRSSPILYSIKSLNLSHNSLRLLNKNFSFYFPSVEQLDLSHNRLILLGQRTLSNFLHLKELFLHDNRLKHLQPDSIPRQSLQRLNLNGNLWHCSCRNIQSLALSRPLPTCRTPSIYFNQNVSDIARQCLLLSRANLSVSSSQKNLSCAAVSTIDHRWKTRPNRNFSSIESIDDFETLPKNLSALVCFDLNATEPESIAMIFIRTNRTTLINVTEMMLEAKESSLLDRVVQLSKTILPHSFEQSNRQALIIWFILLLLALLVFLFVMFYLSTHHRERTKRIDAEDDPQTLFHLNFNCKNHKCLCQYRRRTHSSLVLPSNSSTSVPQPSYIEPSRLGYAKIKRISSSKQINGEYSPGEFRTLIKLKNLPN